MPRLGGEGIIKKEKKEGIRDVYIYDDKQCTATYAFGGCQNAQTVLLVEFGSYK